jgi:hypothetical protein
VLPDVAVPQLGNFPNAFADVNLGLVQLRRRPVVIAARTMQLGPGDRMEKLPLATVQVTGIWRRVADLSGAAAPPDLVAIRPALSARRPAPGTTLEPVSMPSIGGPVRRLVRAAEPGAATIEVSRTGSLGAPDVVAIDPGDPDRVEYIEVHDVTGPSDPESPATVVLAFPVQQRHREGVLAMEVAPTPIGLGTADLTAEGLPGDPTVFVATVAPFAAPAVVHITGGTAPDEYAVASTYVVDTDGEGYGRLPPLTRVAAVEVAASKTGPPALAAPPTAHTPNYGITENPLSLLLE